MFKQLKELDNLFISKKNNSEYEYNSGNAYYTGNIYNYFRNFRKNSDIYYFVYSSVLE